MELGWRCTVPSHHTFLTHTHSLCRLVQSCCVVAVSAGWLAAVVAAVALSAAAGVASSSGGLGAWWMPSVSNPSPHGKPSSSSSSSCSPSSSSLAEGSRSWSFGGAVVSLLPCSWRRLSRLLRSFLSFCRALHSLSSSSSFPCRALKCPSRRVFYNTIQYFVSS